MKTLLRILLPALLCAVTVPSTCQAKWSLFSRLKCHKSCRVASPCSMPCAQPVVACPPVVANGCCASSDDTIVVGMTNEIMPVENVYYENEVNGGGVIPAPPIAGTTTEPTAPSTFGSPSDVAEPMPTQPVADDESIAKAQTEQALAESEKALKQARAQAKKAKAELQAAEQEMATAMAASKEQIEKLKTQNANLKKNLDAARQRIERMQAGAGDQQAKREDEPTAKAAADTKKGKGNQPGAKKPGERKPANKKKAEEKADNTKPAAKEGKKAAAENADSKNSDNL